MAAFSSELFTAICEDISGGKSLRAACEPKGRPNKRNFLRWLEADETLRPQYARAREEQAEHFADELIEIVDSDPDPSRARVRMDARKWAASKLAPKKYGDKIAVAGDPDGEPIKHEHSMSALMERIAGSGRKLFDPS